MAVFDDLGIESRRQILGCLMDGPLSVNEIVAASNLKQSNVSNHLARMRDTNTVRFSRMGREVIYSLASPEVADAVRRARIHRVPTQVDLAQLVEPFAQAALLGDENACTMLVDRALRAERSLVDIMEDLLAASMYRIGQLYQTGAVSIAEEHAASAVTERMLARVSAAQIPQLSNGLHAVVGCAPGNWHSIGSRMVADLLRAKGWRVMFLGANVPQESFVSAIKDAHPDLVSMSTSYESRADARATIEAIGHEFPGVPISLGGSGVSRAPEFFEGLHLTLLTTSLRQTSQWLDHFRSAENLS